MSGLRVLCLDIEGGFGGSSRSLFETLRHVDRGAVEVEVWCRRPGPIQERYGAIGIPVRVEPEMPRFSALPTLSRNLYVVAGFARAFRRAARFRDRLRHETERRFDVVHFNHEGLFWLARWLRPRVKAAFSMHVRTNILPTAFARFQVRAISRAIDHRVFITENEAANYRRLGGTGAGSVIYNPAPTDPDRSAPDPGIVQRGTFRIACIANYSHGRGIDRLANLAEALSAAGNEQIHFVVAGSLALTRSLPGALGEVARAGGDLSSFVEDRGVGRYFTFLGHVSDPERVLASCHMLIKPTRMADPWGRDVIEAMAAGKPVVSFGTWDGFIRHGETGLLFETFDAAAVAAAIAAISRDPERVSAMGAAARTHILRLCDGPARAAELLAVWQGLVEVRALARSGFQSDARGCVAIERS